MKNKNLDNLFKVYDALGLSDRKVYTYDLTSDQKCIDSEYFYSSFSEAVSDASIEGLHESEIFHRSIYIWIYEIENANSEWLHSLKGFEIRWLT